MLGLGSAVWLLLGAPCTAAVAQAGVIAKVSLLTCLCRDLEGSPGGPHVPLSLVVSLASQLRAAKLTQDELNCLSWLLIACGGR